MYKKLMSNRGCFLNKYHFVINECNTNKTAVIKKQRKIKKICLTAFYIVIS